MIKDLCKCDKSCYIREYLDYKNCKCRKKKLVNNLVEECIKSIDEDEMIANGTLNDHKNMCSSCTIYIVLFAIFVIISISISSVFIYFHWYLKRSNTNAETVFY